MALSARQTDRAVRFGLGVLAVFSLLAVSVYAEGPAWRGQVAAASLLFFAASMFVTVGVGRRRVRTPSERMLRCLRK